MEARQSISIDFRPASRRVLPLAVWIVGAIVLCIAIFAVAHASAGRKVQNSRRLKNAQLFGAHVPALP